MNTTEVGQFNIVGIAIKTTNERGQASIDIPQLWNKFFLENIINTISNKIDNTIYCIYTDYEFDYTKPYTTILGCRVNDLNSIPTGFTGKLIESGSYSTFKTKGKLNDGIVFQEWTKIWNTNLERVYTADFEVYGHKELDPDNVEINIFVAVK